MAENDQITEADIKELQQDISNLKAESRELEAIIRNADEEKMKAEDQKEVKAIEQKLDKAV